MFRMDINYLYYKIFDCSRQALANFKRCAKPGGLLLIDHRNYDYIIKTGQTPSKCIYYNVRKIVRKKCYVLLKF